MNCHKYLATKQAILVCKVSKSSNRTLKRWNGNMINKLCFALSSLAHFDQAGTCNAGTVAKDSSD